MLTTRDEYAVNARIDALLDELCIWKERAKVLEYEATHDPMTGTLNRRGLYATYENRRFKYAYVIDVDGLKGVNDSLGHAAGDKLITDVVTKLKEMAEIGNGVVARVGGDEFVLLVDSLVMTGPITNFSHGWACMENGSSLDEALTKADTRMYTRKVSRKNNG